MLRGKLQKIRIKQLLIEDKKAKSTSFFFRKEGEVFNYKHINFLESYYKKEKKDIRICLHTKKCKTPRYDYTAKNKKIFILLINI